MSKEEHYSLESWFDGGVQSLIVKEWFSACSPATHGVLQVFTLGSVPVNIFTNDMEEMMKCTLSGLQMPPNCGRASQ